MSTPFHTQVAMDNVPQTEWQFTAKLASGITAADIGKALTLDSSANQFKLATDGAKVHARLLQVENRVQTGQLLGTIALKFIDELPLKSGETPAVGNSVLGAGGGEVKVGTDANNIVLEVRSASVVVYVR